MANTRSAKKMVRKIAARTDVNQARRSRMRTFIRKVEEAIEAVKDLAYDIYLFFYDKRNKRCEREEQRDKILRKIAFCEEGELDNYLRKLEEL